MLAENGSVTTDGFQPYVVRPESCKATLISQHLQVVIETGSELSLQGQVIGWAECTGGLCDIDLVISAINANGTEISLNLGGQFRIEHEANP